MNILLLTNRDWDNLGDKVMEACDIALLKVVMKNLGIGNYAIDSRDADLISPQYLTTRNPEHLEQAEDIICSADMIVFGGAPMFNYVYQNFYERTSVMIDLAQKHHKPVIFSAIGIEGYDADNAKCLRLKEAINQNCVKQITTRDGHEFLEKYVENPKILTGNVADSAVFSSYVFARCDKSAHADTKKKIGIFILRANGFKDNRIDFSREQSIALWKGLICELEARGYDYELLTSGHFGDEAFLQCLMKECDIPSDKCVFNMDVPEKLTSRISMYDGVVSCRLHPNIVAFSYEVPAIGIVWNAKVRDFYRGIGYAERVLETDGITPGQIADRLEAAMAAGVQKEEAYLMRAYRSLFDGIRCATGLEDADIEPYNYREVLARIPLYEQTAPQEQSRNYERKLSRIYDKYNDQFLRNQEQKRTIASLREELKAERKGYSIIYNAGTKSAQLSSNYDETKGELKVLPSGSTEYRSMARGHNDGGSMLLKNHFSQPDYDFKGWRLRVKCRGIWHWYLENHTLIPTKDFTGGAGALKRMLLADEERIPVIEGEQVQTVILEAVWKKKCVYRLLYNSGIKSLHLKSAYTMEEGEAKLLSSGSMELTCAQPVSNGASVNLMENKFQCRGFAFLGWRLRVKINQQWFWYLSDGTLFLKDAYADNPNLASIQTFLPDEKLPCFPSDRVKTVVAEAVWKKKVHKGIGRLFDKIFY